MQSWYSSMAPMQRRTFWGCFLGWVLDAMDVQIFAFVIPTLITIWGTAGSFSYNFGRGIGALVPAAVGLTSTSMGLAPSIGI